jgi:hypothetical protein
MIAKLIPHVRRFGRAPGELSETRGASLGTQGPPPGRAGRGAGPHNGGGCAPGGGAAVRRSEIAAWVTSIDASAETG